MKRTLAGAALVLVPSLLAGQTGTTPDIVPQPASTLPRHYDAKPTGPAISPEDLMSRLYLFADDSMQGREAGTIGNFKGTAYLAREAERIGLQPVGENGTFFQILPFKTRSIDSSSTLTAGGAALTLHTEWVAGGNRSASLTNVPAVFAGALGDTTLTREQAHGKLLVYRIGPAGFRGLQNAADPYPGAAGTAVIVPDRFLTFLGRPVQFVDDQPAAEPADSRPLLFLTQAAANRLFHTSLDSAPAGIAGTAVSLDLQITVKPVPFPARNVVAVLPGSDPTVAGEYVAIGAHNDHVGFNNRPGDHDSLRIFTHLVRPGGAEDGRKQATPEQQADVNAALAAWRSAHPGTSRLDSIANGADDDGSGSVSVLEIAQHLMATNPHPRRSILFVWHVGEEKGLLGAAYFTDHPTVPRDSIVAQLNIDMVGRGDAWDVTGETKDGHPIHGQAGYLQLVGSRRLSTELGDLAERVNTEGKHGLVFDHAMDANGHPMNIYCRSDHYEYARYGIPIVFFTTGGHSDYHQVTDEPQYIDYEHMARVDRFIADLAVHVADLGHRVVVDQPKPDPHGRCRQ